MLKISGKEVNANICRIVAAIFVSILLIFTLLLTSIEWVAFDIDFYEAQYDLLERPQAIGISKEDLLWVTSGLLDYMSGRREALDIRSVIQGEERYVFNEREIAHMVDVRNLFAKTHLSRNVSLISVILIIASLVAVFGGKIFLTLAKSYLAISIASLLVLGSLVLFAIFDFTLFWDLFHRISFDNYLWLLDPRTDILIQMVPEQFFYNTVMAIIVRFVIGILLFAALSVYCIIAAKRGKNHTLANRAIK